MTTPPLDDLHQWLSVSFYAQVPVGQVVTGIDSADVATALMEAFGFTTITGLTVAAIRPGERTPPS